MEQLIKLKENQEGFTHIEARVIYSKGDYRSPRGYYLHLFPIKREIKYNCVMTSSVSGFGSIYKISAVDRKSKKAEQDALQVVKEALPELIAALCSKYNLEVEQ